MNFEFATSARIIFGTGKLSELGQLIPEFGKNVFVVSGGGRTPIEVLVESLKQSSSQICEVFEVNGEPTIDTIKSALDLARGCNCGVVIGYGGGSVLDTAKGVAALLTNPGDILDYLEVVGKSYPLKNRAVPMVAIPTTAGTGSEVTRNAVISIPEKGFKVSLRSPYMLPRLALIDPELAITLPPSITASTGLDAFTQLLEPYVSLRANPLTDLFCQEGLEKVSRSILRAYQHGEDIEARQNMAWGSLLGGLSLANAGLGAVHGFAAAIGGMYNAPHGAVCARLLPGVVAMNIKALCSRQPDSGSIPKFIRASQIITDNPKSTNADGIRFLSDLITQMEVPGLMKYGITKDDLPGIAEKSMQTSSMKGNPIKLSPEELLAILEEAL